MLQLTQMARDRHIKWSDDISWCIMIGQCPGIFEPLKDPTSCLADMATVMTLLSVRLRTPFALVCGSIIFQSAKILGRCPLALDVPLVPKNKAIVMQIHCRLLNSHGCIVFLEQW